MNDTLTSDYQKQLTEKSEKLLNLFSEFQPGKLQVYASPKQHYRMRTEFRIWHSGDKINYVMFKKGEKRCPIIINEFPTATTTISDVLIPLLNVIQDIEILKNKLFQIDFLATSTQQLLITLVYHKQLSDEWEAEAKKLQNQFTCFLIGRARKQKITISQDFVEETFQLSNGKYNYEQVENSFTQPNADICCKMLDWAIENTKGLKGDLLELYCGNGNFTLPLSKNFNRVLATEVSKISVKSAQTNLKRNDINNVDIIRLSSEEFTLALNKVRSFRRLANIDLDDYTFNTVFVDPPRSGLDAGTLSLISQFDTIIYISCNPTTLVENVKQLAVYKITQFALFDQFPFTDHIECGVKLQRSPGE